ncbi:MAG TPA: hypothetical protein VGK38_07160 [Prolixibacteraceae bacterium]|jgi:hypothetical protein
MENNQFRRVFFKSSVGVKVGLVGQQTIAHSAGDQRPQETNRKNFFLGEPVILDARIERVKMATLSMQCYDWEQDAVVHAFIEMWEDDLSILFARGAILKPISLQ